MAQATFRLQRLDKFLERQILMGECFQRRVAYSANQLWNRQGGREFGSQHQRVHEEADQVFCFFPATAGYRSSYRYVSLRSVSSQQKLESGHEGHEQSRSLSGAQFFQLTAKLPGQRERLDSSLVGRDRGSCVIGRERKHRRIGKLARPIDQLAIQHVALQPFPLPYREVRVLYFRIRQRRGRAHRVSLVQRGQLSHHYSERPTVTHDVMHRHEKDVLVIGEPQQLHLNERREPEVEWPLCVF